MPNRKSSSSSSSSSSYKHRKKRSHQHPEDTGTKSVLISRGWGGYGFTISSQRPCVLSCIIRRSPADLAGLKAGDFLQVVNGVDVSELPHDDVVRLIGQSTGLLHLQVKHSFGRKRSGSSCHRSDSARKEEGSHMDSECSDKARSDPGRNRARKGRSLPRSLVLQPVGRSRYYTRLNRKQTLYSLPWKSSIYLPEQSQNYSSSIAFSLPSRREVTGQEFSGYQSVEKLSVQEGECFDTSREVIGRSFTPTGRRTKVTDSSVRHEIEFLQEPQLSAGVSQILQTDHFVECPKTRMNTDQNTATTAVESNRHALTFGISRRQEDHLPHSLQSEADSRAVVGYIGSIQLPDSLNSSINRLLLQLRSSVRRLRKIQKFHALVLMEINACGVRLTSGAGGTVAFYPAEEIILASLCPEHKQFFGIITANPGHEVAARELQATPSCSLSSCHVFMVDAFMACHTRHVHRAEAFSLHCQPCPDTQLCEQFPQVPDDLVLHVASLYEDRPRRNTESPVFLDFADHPQYQVSSSSGSDSGLSMGQGDVCEQGICVPDFMVQSTAEEKLCSYNESPKRFRTSTKDTKTKAMDCQPQMAATPEYLSPELGLQECLPRTPVTPEYLSQSPLYPECPHNTPEYSSPASSSLECLVDTTPAKHNLQPSINAGFLPDTPATSKYLSLSSTDPHILSCPKQLPRILSTEERSETNIFSENAPAQYNYQGTPQMKEETSDRSLGRFWQKDFPHDKEHLPCTNTPKGSTPRKLPISESDLEMSHQNIQPKPSEKQHQDPQQRVRAWLHQEFRSDIIGGENYGAEVAASGNGAVRLSGAEASHQRSASVTTHPEDLGCEKPCGLRKSQTFRRPRSAVPHGNPTQTTSARAAEDERSSRVAGWGLSFPSLLADSMGLRLFTEFLQSEHSEENIKFWMDVETFKRLPDPDARRRKALEIYHTYLSGEASDPVNVDSDALALSLSCFEAETSAHVFDVAQQQIYHLMRMDCYGRFLNSDLYKGHLARVKEGQRLPEVQTTEPTACEGTVKSNKQKRKKSFLHWINNKKSGLEDTPRKTKKETITKYEKNNAEENPVCGVTTIRTTETENVAEYKGLSSSLCEARPERERPQVVPRRSCSTLRGLFAKLCARHPLSVQTSPPHTPASASQGK